VGVHSAQANKLALRLLMQRQLPQLGEYVSLQQEVTYGAGGSSRVDLVLTRPDGTLVYVEVKSVTLAEQYVAGGQGQYSGAPVLPAKAKRGGGARAQGKGSGKGAAALASSTCAASLKGGNASGQTAPSAQDAIVADPAAAQPADGSMIALFPDTVSERAQRHVRELMAVVASGHGAVCLFLVQRSDCQRFAPCHAKDAEYGRLLVQAAAAGVQMVAVGCDLQPAASGGVTILLGPIDVELEYGYRFGQGKQAVP
jgi:DNA-binding sugar fermentation-stimulating protein